MGCPELVLADILGSSRVIMSPMRPHRAGLLLEALQGRRVDRHVLRGRGGSAEPAERLAGLLRRGCVLAILQHPWESTACSPQQPERPA